MVLRKVAIDNRVRYIPKTAQTKEGGTKPKTIKAGSLHRKQYKNYHKTIKNGLLVDLEYLNE